MLLSATLSKPTALAAQKFGRPLIKIKLTAKSSSNGYSFFMEQFTQTQVFHQHLNEDDALAFLDENIGKTFKNCVKRTENQEITIMASRKGRLTTLVKNTAIKTVPPAKDSAAQTIGQSLSRKKNHLIPEGTPVPFLILLGIMTSDGKVIASRQDKFRQINRFLEFIDDVLDDVCAQIRQENRTAIRIADFGCGKSYLTFAVHYFLTEVKKIPCEIEGLDLKQDVIAYCNQIAQKLSLDNLIFKTGDISGYSGDKNPDIVITLHACDTATDFALRYAVAHGAKAILSVPCCQHQVNGQLDAEKRRKIAGQSPEFEPLLKWGIIREKFSSLVTDALRGKFLEQHGYRVQMLEFIDIEHTPKNILIRAVRDAHQKNRDDSDCPADFSEPALSRALEISPEIWMNL